MISRRNAIKLAAATLMPSSALVASAPIRAATSVQSSQVDGFAHRGNAARTGEMLGVGLTVTDPVLVHGYYSNDSSGVMRFGRAPAVYNDVVYFETTFFSAYKVGYSNELWSTRLIGTNFNFAAVGSGVVCVADIDNELHGIDAASGNALWSFSEASSWTAESPVIANGLVYVDKIISRDVRFPVAPDAKTGTEVWTYTHDGRVGSPMTVVDDLVLFNDGDYQLYALDALSGQFRWQIETATAFSGPIAVADGIAILGGNPTELSSGEMAWGASDINTGRYITNPAIANGTVYFGTDQGYVVARELHSGESVWEFELGDGIVTDPAVSNGVVYVGVNRFLYALDATTGNFIWSYEFEGYDFETVGSPVLGGGFLFITVGDGRLYAITNQVTTYYVIQDVDVYSEPSTSSSVVARLSGGASLDQVSPDLEEHEGIWWTMVAVGDVTGWVDFVSVGIAKSPVFVDDLIFSP